MIDVALRVATGLVAGTLLGLVVFGGLKLTVDRLAVTTRPLLVAGVSLLVRMGSLVGGLVLLSRWAGLAAMVAAMAGILCARHLVLAAVRGEEVPA